jgi:hypothetical protein
LTATDTGLLLALEMLIDCVPAAIPSPRSAGPHCRCRAWPGPCPRGHLASATIVGRLLHAMGYRLQGRAKTTEGARHPDRDAQFAHINATATAFLDDGRPEASVDTRPRSGSATATGPACLAPRQGPDQGGLSLPPLR